MESVGDARCPGTAINGGLTAESRPIKAKPSMGHHHPMNTLRRVQAHDEVLNENGCVIYPRCQFCNRFIYHAGGIETPRSWVCLVCVNSQKQETAPGLWISLDDEGRLVT